MRIGIILIVIFLLISCENTDKEYRYYLDNHLKNKDFPEYEDDEKNDFIFRRIEKNNLECDYQCKGKTIKNERCLRKTKICDSYCWQHK